MLSKALGHEKLSSFKILYDAEGPKNRFICSFSEDLKSYITVKKKMKIQKVALQLM